MAITMKWMIPVFVLFLAACGGNTSDTEATVATVDQLVGKWNLASASRNGLATNTMDGAFFNFSEGELNTNWLGAPSTTSFELDDNTITTEGNEIVYSIEKLSPTVLELTTTYRSYRFSFTLTKEE